MDEPLTQETIEQAHEVTPEEVTPEEVPTREKTASVWDRAVPAPEFAAQEDTAQESIVDNLLVPQGITLLAARRGVGKSLMAMALAIAATTGRPFLGKTLQPLRILLLDRDNSSRTIRRNLRGWGVEGADNLRVFSRADGAPSLLDKQAWQHFPVSDYDLVIIDSMGSATEGVSEAEGRLTQQAMAVLKDLAARGPAILVLDNTIKSGQNIRGRGEKMDAVDIVYEVRDTTGWTPQGEYWWTDLPEAGEHAWADQAARHKKDPIRRLAFVPTKYRPGVEPEPFILAINFSTVPWTITDVTAQVTQEGEQQARIIKGAQQDLMRQACDYLVERLLALKAGEHLTTNAAVTLLMMQGVTQKVGRNLLETFKGERWDIRPIPGRGNPKGVFPLGAPPEGDKNPEADTHQQSDTQATHEENSRVKQQALISEATHNANTNDPQEHLSKNKPICVDQYSQGNANHDEISPSKDKEEIEADLRCPGTASQRKSAYFSPAESLGESDLRYALPEKLVLGNISAKDKENLPDTLPPTPPTGVSFRSLPDVSLAESTPNGARLPCRDCGDREYWQDGPMWRCVACWPPPGGMPDRAGLPRVKDLATPVDADGNPMQGNETPYPWLIITIEHRSDGTSSAVFLEDPARRWPLAQCHIDAPGTEDAGPEDAVSLAPAAHPDPDAD